MVPDREWWCRALSAARPAHAGRRSAAHVDAGAGANTPECAGALRPRLPARRRAHANAVA